MNKSFIFSMVSDATGRRIYRFPSNEARYRGLSDVLRATDELYKEGTKIFTFTFWEEGV